MEILVWFGRLSLECPNSASADWKCLVFAVHDFSVYDSSVSTNSFKGNDFSSLPLEFTEKQQPKHVQTLWPRPGEFKATSRTAACRSRAENQGAREDAGVFELELERPRDWALGTRNERRRRA